MENYADHAINFYTQFLTSLGLTVHGRRIVTEGEDGEEDVIILGRQLVLPTLETLKASKWDTEIAFNPLCENTLRGESEVQQEILLMVRAALNGRLGALMWYLGKVADSKQCKENKLNPEQAEFLTHLPGFDSEMVKRIGKMVLGVDAEEYKTCLIHINLKRKGKIGGQSFSRAAMVRFPLVDMTRDEKPYGASLRVKDYDAVQSLLSYILPNWDIENTYSRGTDSKIAPYFVATLLAYQNINARITEIAELFHKDFPDFGSLVNPDEWVGAMSNLAKMRDAIPTLDGNEGSVAKGQAEEAPPIANPPPTRSISMPQNKTLLPWEDDPNAPAQPAQPAVRRDEADDEVVEYVPRQAQPQQQNGFGSFPGGQPQQQYSAPYSAPQPGRQLSFYELQQQRMQQQYGNQYNTIANNQPPVGGSPFSNSNTQQQNNMGHYNVTYTNGQPQNNAPVNTGRGF